ncbi:MAG: hypothetical protein DRP13_03115 [Candidatus Aenigmatarchaeota archaeon]|nr:MAG: hypothetical protein DRP13_03115 [Candidatus Aenigmarchaeota archaeon]
MSVALFQFGGWSPQSGAFYQILLNMENMGFFLYLFPFLLALAIFYGVLKYTMGDRLPKSAIGLISIIFSFFVMLYSSWNYMIVSFFANLGGMGLIVGCGLLFVIILLGITGFKINEVFSGTMSKWAFILTMIFIGVLIFFGAGAGWLIQLPYWSTAEEFWTALFFIVILALAMWWLGGSEAEKKEENE